MNSPARAALATILLAACAEVPSATPAVTGLPDEAMAAPVAWPDVPEVPSGALQSTVARALDRLVAAFAGGSLDRPALDAVVASEDARLGWILSDMLRFVASGGDVERSLVDAFAAVTGTDPRDHEALGAVPWLSATNLLIGWDLPAHPGYREHKAVVFLPVEPAWEPFFADADAAIDWRWVSWGGVFIDDREIADRRPCARGCIPALDDPVLTPADEGDWYPDDRIVFGIVVNGEAVALPKHIMEVHEMVNVTVGGTRLGVPYCTLCGSAQAYLTGMVPAGTETPVLRTSGLLSRSNKVMYDLVTGSVFDTFTGEALSGPLQDVGLVLDQTSVVVSGWGDWKAAHPESRIVAEDGGIGRDYPDDPLAGRDDAGPIFPTGPVDPRLPAHTAVVGVIGPDGAAIAFPVEQSVAQLRSGGEVAVGRVEAVIDGSGLRVRDADGQELPAHEAFWFAWSQFHPRTSVWSPLGR